MLCKVDPQSPSRQPANLPTLHGISAYMLTGVAPLNALQRDVGRSAGARPVLSWVCSGSRGERGTGPAHGLTRWERGHIEVSVYALKPSARGSEFLSSEVSKHPLTPSPIWSTMYHLLLRLAALAGTSLFALAQGPVDRGNDSAQGKDCFPCTASGSCAAVEPLVSGGDHACENHAHHNHIREILAAVDFSYTSFGKADLRGSEFYACTMQRASFYGADLSLGKLIGCDADYLVLAGARAAGADFSGSSLRNGYHVGADLTGAIAIAEFTSSDLSHVDFTGATLSLGSALADFSNANLSDAIGLADTLGVARYSACTNFSGTDFDPVAAGWILVAGAEIGERYCTPAVPNSTGNAAEIVARGCLDVASNSLELTARYLPTEELGVFLCSLAPGQARAPGSQGALCLSGEIGAYSGHVQSTGLSGVLKLHVDLDEIPSGMRTGVASGDTWYYQALFRDWATEGGNSTRTSNLSDAVAVTFD